eukprot:229659_1
MSVKLSALCKQLYLKDNSKHDLPNNADESKYNYSSRHLAYKIIDRFGWKTFYINLLNEIDKQKCLRIVPDQQYNTKYQLCNYYDDQFKIWNEYTIICRGLIIDPNQKQIIAAPFPKFFNYEQYRQTVKNHICKQFKTTDEKNIDNDNNSEIKTAENAIPTSHAIYEKVDGSLGICFYCKHSNHWRIITRGHFNSPQAQWAMKYISDRNINLDTALIRGHTYLFEIIYKANQIGVNYGDFEGLVLLGGYNNCGYEYRYEYLKRIAEKLQFKIAVCYTQKYENIESLIVAQKLIDKNIEGFVLCLNNGFRVKFKGYEYLNMIKLKNYDGTEDIEKNVKTCVIVNGIFNKREILKKYEDEFYVEVGEIFDKIYGDLMKGSEECVHDLLMTNNLGKNQLLVCRQKLNNDVKFIEKARKICDQNLWKSCMGKKSKKVIAKSVQRITNEMIGDKKWRLLISNKKKK